MKSVSVFAPSNIALAKYWGKRDTLLNLPTHSSISITLADFGSTTQIQSSLDHGFQFSLNGVLQNNSSVLKKIFRVIEQFDCTPSDLSISSDNNIPTGSGLASSASGLAALTFALSKYLQTDFNLQQLSRIARLGSGSACRSFFGGFVEWRRGELADGHDSFGVQLFDHLYWPLQATIFLVSNSEKATSSSHAMELSRLTSPYFSEWVNYAQYSVLEIKKAIVERDFLKLAELSEMNCLRMHSCILASSPPILYWSNLTVSLIHKVQSLRKEGVPVFFTIDAGANVVLIYLESAIHIVKKLQSEYVGITSLNTSIGTGPKVLL